MKKCIFCLSMVFLVLFASCSNSTEVSTPPKATDNSVTTRIPASTPAPEELFEPVQFIVSLYESSDDTKRLYIKTQYIDPYCFEAGTPERQLADDIHSDMEKYLDYIRNSANAYPATEENLVSYGLNTFITITRNDEHYLCAYVDYYTYEGGAHDNLYRQTYVYNRLGTRFMELDQIIAPGKTIEDVENEINKQMREIIEEQGQMFYGETVSFDDLYAPPGFYIKDDRLIVFFQTYEIAPYAAGIQEFTMPADFLPTEE